MDPSSDSPLVDWFLMQNKSAESLSADILALGSNWVRICVEKGGCSQAWFAQVNDEHVVNWIASWPLRINPGIFSKQVVKEATHYGKPYTFQDHTELISGGLFPLFHNKNIIGLLGLQSDRTDFFNSTSLAWIQALVDAISLSILQIKNQVSEIQSKYSISRILQSDWSLQHALPTVLEILTNSTKADAAILLKFDSQTRQFELLSHYGFDTRALAKVHLYMQHGLARRVVNEGCSILGESLQIPLLDTRPINHLSQEGFSSHSAFPLTNRGKVLGILEFFWRDSSGSESLNLDFIQIVGESIAFALERDSVYQNLKRRNDELNSTYTATIEGLSRALELRDIETEGHTRRVSALAVQLAKRMGIPGDQHEVIQQGALLHDIGKLGIPDAILLKPGSLNEREWKIMQQHPIYAYNILAPIISLQQALEIPLYHHERWDGSGYPYGLKREQIPLSARLFTVVDVYDALTSDRPYRAAWPRSQTLEYLHEQVDIQFDSKVVEKFLELIISLT